MFIKELSYFNTKGEQDLINVSVADDVLQMDFKDTIITKPRYGFNELECSINSKMAKKLKDNYFSAKVENNQMHLMNDDYEVKVDVEEYGACGAAKVVDKEPNIEVELNKAEFLDKLNKIKKHMLRSDDPMSKNLAGIYFEFNENEHKVVMIASDSYKLGVAEFNNQVFTIKDSEASYLNNLILNRHDVLTLEKICKDNKNIATITIKILEGYFQFEVGKVFMQAPIVDTKYPNYKEIISGFDKSLDFAFPTNEMKKVLAKSKELFSSSKIIFESEDNVQTLKIVDDSSPNNKIIPTFEVTPIKENDRNITLGFDTAMVNETISKFKEDVFVWRMTGEINHSKIFEEKDVYYVVMPTRF